MAAIRELVQLNPLYREHMQYFTQRVDIADPFKLVRSRRPVVWSHAIDSCPSHDAVGGFLFEFEAVRTASGPSRRVRETAVASMASSRDGAAATPSS